MDADAIDPASRRRMSLILSLAGILLIAGLWWQLAQAIPVPRDAATTAGRLAVGLSALLPAAAVPFAMILVQTIARFLGGVFDPLAGAETRFLQVNQRVISNTVEQFAVFAPAFLALCAAAPPTGIPAALALSPAWAAARLVFWFGYLAHPMARAPGMAATVAAVLAALGGAAWVWWLAG